MDCPLPLAHLPDGVLALILSFGSMSDIIAANQVCQAWVMHGNRLDLWVSVGKAFEVGMPASLGPQAGATAGAAFGAARQKRALRSASNAKRTFFKSWAAAVKADTIKHDTTLAEAYTLFRMQDSVVRLRTLLRRRWGLTFPASSKLDSSRGKSSSSSNNNNNGLHRSTKNDPTPSARLAGIVATSHGGSTVATTPVAASKSTANGSSTAGQWHKSGSTRWTFDVNHRHGIFEGNTMLNFAVRCGRKKCVEFILWKMHADTEIPDYGGFTPLLNAAWRGDLPLLKQLLAAGARLDVKGVSRGVGPHGPLAWAEYKNRPLTAAFLRSVTEGSDGEGGGGTNLRNARWNGDVADTDVRVDAP